MVNVRSIVTAPFRAVWFLLTLLFFLLFWLLSLVKTCLLAIVRLPLYYLGRVRRRAAVAWEWTKERGRAKLALPRWGVKASQSTQTLEEDEDDDVYSTPLPLSRPPSGHFSTASLLQRAPLLNPELLLKLHREARKRSTSKARRREIAALLELFLQPESPVSSPGESEREEAEEERDTGASGQSYPVIQDENSLRLILELMSLSNTPGDTRDQDEEARKRKARELVSVYHYDRGRLQELISELEAVSFDISSSHKKSKRGKDSSRHSHIRRRGHRSSKSPLHHSRSKHTSHRPSQPSHYSDTESDDAACVTAEDGFSDEEEEEPHTSEYHSPPEDLSDSEEEEEEEERGERIRAPKRVRSKSHQDSARLRRPPKTAKATVEVGETGTPGEPVPDERPRLGSDRLCSYTGVLSPVHESPEYARTPSNPTSADELESDLNRVLLQLDSETSGLQADAREVEYIEQMAAQISEASQSGSPSPFPSSAPPTPNTVVWEKGKCVEISCTEGSKGEEGKNGKEVEAGERDEGGNKGGEEGGDGEEEGEGGKERGEEGGEFAVIPKTAPSLGLKEGHDRQQLAVARSSARRRPPSRHTSTQSESGGSMAGEMMAVDAEMELLEKQLQQSVDSLSTLLEKKERGGGKKKEEEEGEREEKEEGESGSEGDDDQSEGDFLERRRAPSLSDQMSLLSPGSQRLTARDLSPDSALEDSTNSIPSPDPPAGPPSAERTTPDNAHPPSASFSSSSQRVITSTSSSPGAPLLEERESRPRSHSCDSQRRFGGPLSSSPREKPLMIPSSIPPWLEMRNVSATRIEPMPPKPPIHTFTPQLPLHPRTRASSHPPINDPLPTTKQQSTSQGELDVEPTPADQEDIYDTLPPANERIYEVTPVRYLHQSIGEGVGSPAVESRKPLRLRQEEEVEEGRREERKSRSGGEKTHSSRGREERGREKGRERERERKRDRDEKEREKERRHRSHSAERSDTHHSSRHGDRDRERERERERDRGRHSSRHHSSSSDRHGRSKETSSSSSRKHGSSSKSSSSDHRKEDGDSKRLSSKERKEKEKEREEEKGKDKDKSFLKGLRFSFRTKSEKSDSGGKTSKSEREKSSRSSGRSSRHRHEDEEEGEGGLHRSPSRFSVVSTSAISSPKDKHPDAMKKATSLSSLSISGSSQGSPILSHDDGHDVLV